MSELWLLLKANVINTLRLNKKISKSQIIPVSLLAYAGFLALGFFCIYSLKSVYVELGAPQMILIEGITLGFLLIILLTISVANGYIFRCRDFDLLMSLPVRTQSIVASKIVFLLGMNYLFFFILYCPTIYYYLLHNQASFGFYLMILPTFLFMPMLPIAVSGLISYLLGFIPIKKKYRSILFSILLIGLVVAFFLGQFLSIDSSNSIFNSIGVLLGKINYPGELAVKGMTGDIESYLIFIAISVLTLIGFIYLVAANYLKTNNRSLQSEVNKTFVLKEIRGSSPTKALIGKELRRYLSSTIYVTNTIISPIMSLLIIVIYIILRGRIPEFEAFNDYIPAILLVGIVFTLSMTSTTGASISIEGKQFWILKSLPCPERQVFFAKIFVNLIISVPILVIDVIVSLAFLRITALHAVFIFLTALFMLLYTSLIGLYANLLAPRFDYDNDAKAVKQSMSAFLTMAFGTVATVILGASGYGLYLAFNGGIAMYALLTVIAFAFALVSYLLLHYHGTKLYRKLSV